MSPDRESFIDLASPTFSPRAAEFQSIGIPPTSHSQYTEQPISRKSSDSQHGKSASHSSPGSSSASSKPRLARLVPPTPDKPPVPTAPKPDFSYRSRSANRSSPSQSKKHSPLSNFAAELDSSLPTFSTSNALTPRERADRIRTTRKLQQVFGQPPGVSPVSQDPQELTVPVGCIPMPGPLALNLSARRKHQAVHRPAVSMSDDVANTTPVYDAVGEMVWPPPDGTRYVTLAARRHSAPLSPDSFAFVVPRRSTDSASMLSIGRAPSSVIEIGTAEGVPESEAGSSLRSRRGRSGAGPGSPRSFIDLSDEEGMADAIADLVVETPKASRGRSRPFSPSTASLADSLSSDYHAEEERRRKREKLAKLHRFLGSRVPPHLVLGPLEGAPLPPPASSPNSRDHDDRDDDGGDSSRPKMRRRRSSSAAEFSRTWSDDIDRLKEELNEREKAINVRRAVKMEKMFGVAPPQTLYHTRAPVSSSPNISTNAWQPSPSTSRAPPTSPPLPPFRFTTTGPSTKAKSKKRPGTGDSSTPLMDDHRSDGFLAVDQSSVYMHYRHSLNSLKDIIDRDDKESLAELHDYITGDGYQTGEQYDYQFGGPLPSTSNAPAVSSPLPDEFAVTTPTTKAERRRSLPSRVSIASFTSEISMIIAPTPTETAFQQRRRRAAKLTHFFGVDYRDLMGEILDSIERGLEEESGKGTLKPDEVKDLQQKLVSLKTKRNSLSR
ncbi:hypothetical protein K466DRAFT_475073 [Polyporus arcularius HHB13444]|uniref:Uncharacterized protein n=1 Tax=Polyporus arcularius HHB13444 TaxID=1314778 RepID=A0A5C3Q424_9APHY|nr:hypothetical protein K466DRAFT_475073 [Polyporus arcularius HHB13444]